MKGIVWVWEDDTATRVYSLEALDTGLICDITCWLTITRYSPGGPLYHLGFDSGGPRIACFDTTGPTQYSEYDRTLA